MTISRFAVLLVGAMSVAAAHAPAHAASPLTDAFLAKVGDNAAFLEGASRIALDRAGSADVRAYARSEVSEASALSVALADATPASGKADDEGTLRSGRSVGLDAPPPAADPDKADLQRVQAAEEARRSAANDAAGGPAPLGQPEITKLHALHGAAFDAAYRNTQRDALRQIETAYRGYIANGDEPTLRDLAKRDLPTVTRRLAALTKA